MIEGQVNEFKLVMQVASKGSGGPRSATVKQLVITASTEEVDLPNHEVTDEDIEEMKGFSGIKTLILGENKITDIGLFTICASFQDLRQLIINHNQISDQGTERIPRLKHLKCLDIRCNNITSEALKSICQLTELTELSLSKNGITNDNVHLLKALSELRYLDITSNKITEQGGLAIADIKSLHNLYLSNNQVTAKCVWKFLELEELQVLDIRFNALNNEERDIFRAK